MYRSDLTLTLIIKKGFKRNGSFLYDKIRSMVYHQLW